MDLLDYIETGEVVQVKAPAGTQPASYVVVEQWYTAHVRRSSRTVSAALDDSATNHALLNLGCSHLNGAQWLIKYPIKLKLRLYYRAAVSHIKSLIKRG